VAAILMTGVLLSAHLDDPQWVSRLLARTGHRVLAEN